MAKRLRLWPVVGVIGVRQCGKSTLLRDLFHPDTPHFYATMDSLSQKGRASRSPESFCELNDDKQTLIIDEVQKVPDLFDAIKLHVDENRRPGMYVISGSTEFSRLTGVRESLTGRIGLVRLYPLTLAELFSKNCGHYFVKNERVTASISLSDFEKKTAKGGMPGLCFLRSRDEYDAACAMWLETTCYRDLQQVSGGRFDGALALEILSYLAQLSEPTAHAVAQKLRRDTRVIQRYLDAFEAILAVIKLAPHEAGVGKNHYVLCDCGIANYLGASRETVLRTHALIEALATLENEGLGRPLIKYYRNQKTSFVPIVLDWAGRRNVPNTLAIHIYDGETAERRELMALTAFGSKLDKPTRLLLLNHSKQSYFEKVGKKGGALEIHPLRG